MTHETDADRRYSKHIDLLEIGVKGQRRLFEKSVVLIGCGGLGCTIASHLVRAGVGRIAIVDDDLVDLSNIQRQILFDEKDAKARVPKATAAGHRLRRINSEVDVIEHVTKVNPGNIEGLTDHAHLIIDGTDNIESRLLINEVSVRNHIPWIFGGVAGTLGMTMNIIPGKTPCFECIAGSMPGSQIAVRSSSVGLLGTVPAIIGSIQATEALKILLEDGDVSLDLIYFNIWANSFHKIKTISNPDCTICVKKEFPYLEGRRMWLEKGGVEAGSSLKYRN